MYTINKRFQTAIIIAKFTTILFHAKITLNYIPYNLKRDIMQIYRPRDDA